MSNRVLLTLLALTPLSRSLHSIYIPYANMFARVAPIKVLYLFIFSLNQEQIIALSIGKLSTKQTQRKSRSKVNFMRMREKQTGEREEVKVSIGNVNLHF